jgi:CYTH domain-containing protein
MRGKNNAKNRILKEIERKFLVANDAWKQAKCIGQRELKQAYLLRGNDRSVRIRVTDNMAFFTIKLGTGLTRSEFEYEIPQDEANDMIAEADLPCLHKTRYYIQNGADTWELDVFHGALEGLLVAELELSDEEQYFAKPDWLGEEVTFDPAYLNSNLIERL